MMIEIGDTVLALYSPPPLEDIWARGQVRERHERPGFPGHPERIYKIEFLDAFCTNADGTSPTKWCTDDQVTPLHRHQHEHHRKDAA